MKTLYLECQSGISGDMTVAALLDLGADEQVLRKGLESLQVDGYSIHISRVSKAGIGACDFDVRLEGQHHGHSHPHSHEDAHAHSHHEDSHDHHSHQDGHEHGHSHDHHEHGHAHDHKHTGADHGHTHVHRGLGDITDIIQASAISDRAKALAIKIFDVVAQAEAEVHGLPVDQVHFHEVGAVDSIVDIVGAAICIDNLGAERIICSPLREGTGTVRCQHGVIPIPAPATLEIVRTHSVPMTITDIPGELVTPTGAALVAALADSFMPPQAMRVLATGYGAGKRDYSHTANLLRASLIEEEGETLLLDRVVQLSCNLDDITGEELAYACELLLEAGALDVWCAPIYMKKGRPAQLLSVLCRPADEEHMTELLLTHTSTIGVRVSDHRRHIMERKSGHVDTSLGKLAIKEACRGKICKIQIEYESAKTLAKAKNIPINQIFRQAYRELHK